MLDFYIKISIIYNNNLLNIKMVNNFERNVLHLVHLWYEPREQIELEKNISNLITQTSFDLIYIVEEPEIVKLDKQKAEKMIERFNYVWINQFLEAIKLKWLSADMAAWLWSEITEEDCFKTMFEIEWLVFNQEIYDILTKEVISDVDFTIFDYDVSDPNVDDQILKQRYETINHLEKNRDNYYRKLNELVNVYNDLYWFTRELKAREPKNRGRYNRVLSLLESTYPKERLLQGFMYDWLPIYTREQAIITDEDLRKEWKDYDLMKKIMYSVNKEKVVEMLNHMVYRYWNKTKVNHILWWEYLESCVDNYANTLAYNIEELWLDKTHTVWVTEDISIQKPDVLWELHRKLVK